MSRRGRGRGRGGGTEIGQPKMDDDPYNFKEDTPVPLRARVGRNLEKMQNPPARWPPGRNVTSFEEQDEADFEDENFQKALEESKKTAAAEEIIRKVGGIGEAAKQKPVLFQDVVSEDEDEGPKPMETRQKQSKNTFAAVAAKKGQGSKLPIPPTGTRSGKAQAAMAEDIKPSTEHLQAAGDFGRPPRPRLEDFLPKKGSGPDHAGDKSPMVKTRSGATDRGASSTKPKSGPPASAEAAGGSSTASKTISQQVQLGDYSGTEPPPTVEVESNMRFNPFTGCMEPKPNIKPLYNPPVKATNLVRVLLPHDLKFDRAGRALTTPAEKARAWAEMMDEENRKIHEHNLHVNTRPSKTITYHEGEMLGSKGRNLKGDTDLCEWFDTFFDGGLDEQQKNWIKEHQEYMAELEGAKMDTKDKAK